MIDRNSYCIPAANGIGKCVRTTTYEGLDPKDGREGINATYRSGPQVSPATASLIIAGHMEDAENANDDQLVYSPSISNPRSRICSKSKVKLSFCAMVTISLHVMLCKDRFKELEK